MPQMIENGIPVGNWDEKYNKQKLSCRLYLNTFVSDIEKLLDPLRPEIRSISEIGCGEGHLTNFLHSLDIANEIKGCDLSAQVIELARQNASSHDIEFYEKSIYDISHYEKADLIVCCEVLEHLEDPAAALEKLVSVTEKYCLLSVPREPLWRLMNICCAKNILEAGNTPGHIQHWSSREFLKLVSEYFDIIESKKPMRVWTMALCRKKSSS